MAGKAGRRVGMLTARGVKTKKKPGLYGDGGNLFLKVDDGGSKSWLFKHQVNGKARKYGLGPVHTVSLSDARQRAEAVRRLLLDGIDPKEARRAEEEAAAIAEARSISFDSAVAQYIESHKAGWKSDKHAKQWQATLQPTPVRCSASSRCPLSIPASSCVSSSRSGPLRRRRLAGYVAASKAF